MHDPGSRVRPTETGPERQTMAELLDFLRATVAMKASGLTTEQATTVPIATSDLTIGGLVKHLTGVERFWFSIDFADLDLEWPWTDEDPHGNFAVADGETIEQLVQDYDAECERSRQSVAKAEFDDMARGDGMHFSLRYAFAHMVEETARHCGHLDLLREAIDGTTGQ